MLSEHSYHRGRVGDNQANRYRVDMQILEDAEDNYKVRADLGRENWHYEYALKRNVETDERKL